MSTSTARKESRAIRQQMDHVRSRLPYSMDAAKAEAKQFADWKYYVGRFPLTTVGAATALGYLAVPEKKRIVGPDAATRGKWAARDRPVGPPYPKAQRRSPAHLGLNLVTNVLLRAATAFVGQQIGRVVGVDLSRSR